MFGKEFKVLKELPRIFKKVGDNYPEYFHAYEKNRIIEYYIIDDKFDQHSPANYHDGDYAKKKKKRSSNILADLMKEGYIELIK